MIPNDDLSLNGSITLTLTSGPAFHFKGSSFIDDGTFSVSSSVNGFLASMTLLNDNQTGRISGFASGLITVGESITITFSGSGGADSLILTPIPLPAGLPLLLTACGGLGLLAGGAGRPEHGL